MSDCQLKQQDTPWGQTHWKTTASNQTTSTYIETKDWHRSNIICAYVEKCLAESLSLEESVENAFLAVSELLADMNTIKHYQSNA